MTMRKRVEEAYKVAKAVADKRWEELNDPKMKTELTEAKWFKAYTVERLLEAILMDDADEYIEELSRLKY